MVLRPILFPFLGLVGGIYLGSIFSLPALVFWPFTLMILVGMVCLRSYFPTLLFTCSLSLFLLLGWKMTGEQLEEISSESTLLAWIQQAQEPRMSPDFGWKQILFRGPILDMGLKISIAFQSELQNRADPLDVSAHFYPDRSLDFPADATRESRGLKSYLLGRVIWGCEKRRGEASQIGVEVLALKNQHRAFEPELQSLEDSLWLDSRSISGLPVRGRLILNIGEGECRFQAGDFIQTWAHLRVPDRFLNPFSNDYPFFLKIRGVTASAWVPNSDSVVKWGEAREPLIRFKQKFRENMTAVLESLHDKSISSILAALLMGDLSSFSAESRMLFTRTGTSHLIVISGLHFSLVLAFVYSLFRFIFSRSVRFMTAISLHKVSLAAALPVALFYAFLIDFSPSVFRSLLMCVAVFCLILWNKQPDLISLLLFAAFLMLLVDPLVLFLLSFQLSFLSVFCILVGVPRLQSLVQQVWALLCDFWFKTQKFFLSLKPTSSEFTLKFESRLDAAGPTSFPNPREPKGRFARRLSKIFHGSVQTFFACLAVQIGLTPLLLFRFHYISIVSLVVNLLLIPLFGALILPFGFLGLFASFFSEAVSKFFLGAAAYFLRFAVALLSFFSSLSFSYLPVAGFDLLQTLLSYLFLLGFLLPVSKWRRLYLISLLIFNGGYWFLPTLKNYFYPTLTLHFLDVGQGDALLLQLPSGQNLLVDGGGSAYGNSEFGADVLVPNLLGLGIRHLDAVILTHPHPDHYGGLESVIQAFYPKEFWSNGAVADSEAFLSLEQTLHRLGIPILNFERGHSVHFGDLELYILNPESSVYKNRNQNKTSSNVNNESLVLKLQWRGFRLLIAGDIERESEQELLQSGVSLKAEVLKVPHHGSVTSSTEGFLQSVLPQVALIGVGRHNAFGFPRTEVLDRYQKYGTSIFRTDQDGMVSIEWDGERLKIWTFSGRELLLPAP